MIKLSATGIILMLILAIVGGYMTGMFAGYLYDMARHRFNRFWSVALNGVFYVVPVWALFSVGKDDGLIWFYLLLLLFYYLGLRATSGQANSDTRPDRRYELDD
jgi:NhaP-type Na+/H+ or K+/H+ antiporter